MPTERERVTVSYLFEVVYARTCIDQRSALALLQGSCHQLATLDWGHRCSGYLICNMATKTTVGA